MKDLLLHTPMWLIFRALARRSLPHKMDWISIDIMYLNTVKYITTLDLRLSVCNTTALDNVRWDLK